MCFYKKLTLSTVVLVLVTVSGGFSAGHPVDGLDSGSDSSSLEVIEPTRHEKL